MLSRVEAQVVRAVLAYEVAAYNSRGRLPTVTVIARRHPVVGALVIAGLAWHFRPATVDRTLVP